MKIKITADSTCDLPVELAEKYGVHIFPLYVVMDGEAKKDGVEICAQDIFDHVAAGGKLGNTAAVNVGDYLEVFRELRKECDAVIHFTISQSMSACFQNANIAGAEVGNVWVVDSTTLSCGISLLVLDACDMAAEGKSPEEIVAALEAKRDRLDVSFVIDTLFYLQKGGRCSSLVALGANLLKLKPCIEVRNGQMGVGRKYRGKLDACVAQYVRERLTGRTDIRRNRIFITHSGCGAALVERVRKIVAGQGFSEILETRAGCTVSTHCGPNTLGVLFIRT